MYRKTPVDGGLLLEKPTRVHLLFWSLVKDTSLLKKWDSETLLKAFVKSFERSYKYFDCKRFSIFSMLLMFVYL